MKRIFSLMLLAAVSLLAASCHGESGEEGTLPPGNESGYYEFPLNVQEGGFKAAGNGVSIELTSLEPDNIVFDLVPGSAVKSYRVEVYPKVMIYNLLLNEGCLEAETAVCEDKIIQLIRNSTSAGSHVFSASSSDDFAQKEFDWANSEYSSGPILSDCEYFIMVLACYDTEGANPASLCIAHVTTPEVELAGDPQIDVEVETGFRGFIVRYAPNEDCKYFYHWIWSTEEIAEFIDIFGEKMMRDFCRSTVSQPNDVSVPENLFLMRTFDLTDDLIRENTVIAVPVDKNGTPSQEIVRHDFVLPEVPEGEYTPVARIKAGSRIGATLAYIDVEMEKSCVSSFFRLYTAEKAELIRNLSAEEKSAEAVSIANEGWGVANKRFSYNQETGELTGSSFKATESQVELQPDTEYVILYVAKNQFGELSELCFSEPFRTKALVRDNPDACLADVNLTFSDISRWGFKFNFTYDYETTVCYRFQLVYPYDEDDPTTDEDDDFIRPPHYINDADDREKWMEFFYDTYQDGPAGPVPVVNMWEAEPSDRDSYSMFGYESGVTYVYAVCAEDINGVAGPVKFVEVTTTAPNPGPNPTVDIQSLSFDSKSNQISGRFVVNEDAKLLKYFSVTSADASLYSACALHDLVNSSRRDYDTYMTLWESQLIQLGLSSNAEAVPFSASASPASSTPVLVAAVAIGEEDGVDVYSPVAAKIWYNGEFKELSDFRSPVK